MSSNFFRHSFATHLREAGYVSAVRSPLDV